MKIAIDISQTAFPGTGVAKFTQNLVAALLASDPDNEYVLFFASLRGKIPREVLSVAGKKNNVRIKKYPIPPTLLEVLWNKMHTIPFENLAGRADIVYTSDWTEPPVKNARKITTIHDMVAYRYPQTSTQATGFDLKNAHISPNIVAVQKRKLAWVKKECQIVICDSMATKADVMRFLDIPAEKLRVIYPPVSLGQNENSRRFKKTGRPFILTVGTLQPRKNITRLISAFKKADLEGVDLYIAGAYGWGGELTGEQTDHIKFLGRVEDEKLVELYNQALFLVFPSLYEGFGYPAVEAMAYGCPVAASNTSSLKEIVENYGLLFNPESEEEISRTMLTLYRDQSLREELSRKGLVRAKDFSPERFASQMLNVFKEVYGHRS